MFKRKAIWTREEIPIGDYLYSFREALTREFMDGYSSLEEAIMERGRTTLDRPNHNGQGDSYVNMVQVKRGNKWERDVSSWKNVPMKYTYIDGLNNIQSEVEEDDYRAQKFPTAYNLMKEFGDDCPIMNFSVLAPKTAIFRHTGVENRDGKYIRIHIPLIVPEGDVFLEVDGEEITWKDLFGFNNQFMHSAYNLSDQWRLILLVDIDRVRAGLTPGEPYNPRYVAKPFMRRV